MEINEKTKIGLFSVLGTLPVLVGGIIWLSVIYFKAEAAEKMNEKQDVRIENQQLILLDIRDRVIKIESKLNKEK